jgi:hypothetical protein
MVEMYSNSGQKPE